jgi:hypothetical protein
MLGVQLSEFSKLASEDEWAYTDTVGRAASAASSHRRSPLAGRRRSLMEVVLAEGRRLIKPSSYRACW